MYQISLWYCLTIILLTAPLTTEIESEPIFIQPPGTVIALPLAVIFTVSIPPFTAEPPTENAES